MLKPSAENKKKRSLFEVNQEYQTIKWETDGPAGILSINQPPSNEMTPLFFEEMGILRERITRDPMLRGILVTGAGRHFSSGTRLDEFLPRILKEYRESASHGKEFNFLTRNYGAISFFESLNIPVVAVLRGVCLGSAFELALFCHFRFCSEDSVFGLPESTFNLMPGIGGIRKMKELAGTSTALEFILKGKTFGAEEALEHKLVDRILPKKELYSFSLDFLNHIREGYHPQKRALYLSRYLNQHGTQPV